jgi:hypothetical protein
VLLLLDDHPTDEDARRSPAMGALLVAAARAKELHGLTKWPADGDNQGGATVALGDHGRQGRHSSP